jgi:hypothetical protein
MDVAAASRRLEAARRHAQEASDAARQACVLLQLRRAAGYRELVLDVEEWALRQTAELSRLMERLRALETRKPE